MRGYSGGECDGMKIELAHLEVALYESENRRRLGFNCLLLILILADSGEMSHGDPSEDRFELIMRDRFKTLTFQRHRCRRVGSGTRRTRPIARKGLSDHFVISTCCKSRT